jgi:2-oxoglutarate dehydrogenase E1 component
MSTDAYKKLMDTTAVSNGGAYMESLYESYLEDKNSVDPKWRTYFENMQAGSHDVPHGPIQEKFLAWALAPAARGDEVSVAVSADTKQFEVESLINSYRRYGHHKAKTDPLGLIKRDTPKQLTLAFHGLSNADLGKTFQTPFSFKREATLKEIISLLEYMYTGPIGAQWFYIESLEEREWLQKRFEVADRKATLSPELRKRVYGQLTAAEGLERYLHNKYVGQKRFSLEGGETMIPMLDQMIMRAGATDMQEVVIGMAHRGRLNVLVNLLGKPPTELFEEFEGKRKAAFGAGDVKYHQGFSSDVKTDKGVVHLSLASNPSHLEIVIPVVEGSVRARQERRDDWTGSQVLPIAIHGDAAFAGQGCVMETLNMSQTRGYKTGGTIHLIVNNQVGFTTSNPEDSRSTPYCTDIAKMIEAPVFHVNLDDPDAAMFIANIAFDFREKFKKDIVLDLMCYRRYGHNEADEPAATQPVMYQHIRQHPTTRTIYANQLIADKLMTEAETDAFVEKYRDQLDQGKIIVAHLVNNGDNPFKDVWNKYLTVDWDKAVKTSCDERTFDALAKEITTIPANFELQPQVNKVYLERAKMAAGTAPIDWGFAETMAYATLLKEGYGVRLSGQDCGRGTFAHRHAVLHEQKEDKQYIPLSTIGKPHQFTVIDSLLSEEAVLAFEYGYSSTEPRHLVLWEAQFGDFANGAQVVMDQFISSGETKWTRYSGLVMLLPHGYEGMGPEHSSARLERYLQLCADHNMQVCTPTTPAQIFHLLRRQMLQQFRKPLVVMTPKSLLRHRLAVSTKAELINGHFEEMIPEIDPIDAKKVTRVVICGGKVYYDLLQKRRELKLDNVAIIRIEQLYPFPEKALSACLASYKHAKEVVWCQEEPKNQGAWYCSQHHIVASLAPGQTLSYAGRDACASPATGYHSIHVEQQTALVAQALRI